MRKIIALICVVALAGCGNSGCGAQGGYAQPPATIIQSAPVADQVQPYQDQSDAGVGVAGPVAAGGAGYLIGRRANRQRAYVQVIRQVRPTRPAFRSPTFHSSSRRR